uniref:Uncharacterized protein n=1 Tax=Arundo donax TaxID=35708 RepID=A0A0A8YWX4_ARUDO
MKLSYFHVTRHMVVKHKWKQRLHCTLLKQQIYNLQVRCLL